MNEIPILSQNMLSSLFTNVETNRTMYFEGGLDEIITGSLRKLDNTSIDTNLLDNFHWVADEREGELDAINSRIVYKSLIGLTPYQARDERILTAITHLHARKYTIKRHKIGDQDTDKLKRHFFARGNGARSIERDNAIGRLWWNGYFITRCKGKEDFEELLSILCTDTDFRSQLVERPSASMVPQAALAILMCKKKFQEQEPGSLFFKGRDSETPFRKWFRKINLYGGAKLFASMEYEELYKLFWEAMLEVKDS